MTETVLYFRSTLNSFNIEWAGKWIRHWGSIFCNTTCTRQQPFTADTGMGIINPLNALMK